MNIKIALPGDKYYLVPHEILEPYAVSKDQFDSGITDEETVSGDVVGQAYESSSDSGSRPSGGSGSGRPKYPPGTSSGVRG